MGVPRPLDDIEVRVLGALLEKEQTTPDYYPLTVNALIAACNQKSNREPVMEVSEEKARDALDRLRKDVLVWRSDGARAGRWSQSMSRRLELSSGAKALITVLLLRGPQTPGELRARTGRMRSFTDTGEVEETLRELAARVEPLVVELPRRPGQKETRWQHLFQGEVDLEALADEAPPPAPSGTKAPPLASRVTALEDQVLGLVQEIQELRDHLNLPPRPR